MNLVHEKRIYPDCTLVGLLAFILVGISLFLQMNIGLSLSDEGYLWYGAIQTAHGKIPLRDFQSYDPGRYYWASLWSFVFGDGIIALRLSTGIFQAVGLTFGLLTARRVIKSFKVLALVGFVLILWMYPRHKLFEMSLTMAGVFFAVRLIEKPDLVRHFAAGVFVGVAAFFGRNHGGYNAAAFLLLICYIWLKLDRTELLKRLGAWGAGVAVGFSPALVMFLLLSGFLASYISSALFIIKVGSTNLTIPVPWPWTIDYANMSWGRAIGEFSVGFFFLLMPIYYLTSLCIALVSRGEDIQRRGLFIAATFVGIFYMHYAFSRAEINHLAQAIHPLLLSLISIPTAFERLRTKAYLAAGVSVLLLMTLFSVGRVSPFIIKTTYPGEFIEYDTLGDTLWITKNRAQVLDGIKGAVSGFVPVDDKLMIVPMWPGIYCVLERESPVWQTWFVFNEPKEDQEKVIREMENKKVRWVLAKDIPLDNMEERRFSNTHRTIWEYLTREFVPIDRPLPGKFLLLQKRR